MNKEFNYIIVGQGLAGTVLAQTLLNNHKSVLIIDDSSLSKASRVAAGLYNPIVFKRLVKSWMVDDLLPVMNKFYSDAEQLLNAQFYFNRKIVKPFAEKQERTLWQKKTNEEVGRYLSKEIKDDFLNDIIYNSLGVSEVLYGGNLNIELFLDLFRSYFSKHKLLLEEKLDYNELALNENKIQYKQFTADKIIFCEGYKTTDNPYFRWLPFKLTKGEVITIKIPDAIIAEEYVINKGVFILPLGNQTYKVGATYEWNELTDQPTEKGKMDLTDKLKKVIRLPFEIINHEAGIRPTVIDRRPLLGLHPEHKSLAVFNGLGTKGVMLAPYFALHFAEYLIHQSALNKEVDILRFWK